MGTTEDFFNTLRDAKTVFTTPTVLSRKKFEALARDYISQTYGIQLEEAIITGDGIMTGATKETKQGKLVNEVLKNWPQDLLIEELAYSVNWAKAAELTATSINKYGEEAAQFMDKWTKTEGEAVRAYVENLAASYGSDADVRLRTVEAMRTVMANEPLTMGIFVGRGTEGQPSNNWLTAYLSDIETKTAETARFGNPQSQGDPSVPSTTVVPTTTPPSDGSTPTTLPAPPSGGTPIVASQGTTGAFVNIQEFFDLNPQYDFINSLQNEQFKNTEYQYFGDFAQRYGSFTSPSGETWSAINSMNWLNTLYTTNKDKFEVLQDDLRQAGYFDSGLPKKGFLDETTWNAWATFLGDAARNNRTPVEHFVEAKTAIRQGLWDQQIQQNDPASIEANVRDIGTSLIGRPLREDEYNTLLQSVRQWERDYVQGQTFATDQPVTVDLNARIEKYITDTMSTEFALANTYNSLERMKQVFGQ